MHDRERDIFATLFKKKSLLYQNGKDYLEYNRYLFKKNNFDRQKMHTVQEDGNGAAHKLCTIETHPDSNR